MTRNEALDLVAYNDWANAQLLAACSQLGPGHWSRELGGSYPTLLELVAHIVSVEWVWLQRWQGVSPSDPPDWLARPEPTVLRNTLAKVEQRRRDFVASLTEQSLEQDVHYALLDGSRGALPLSLLLSHVVNHSTYHRGQLTSMLRMLGMTPPPTDLTVYALQRRPHH